MPMIIVVDDDDDSVITLSLLLELRGYSVRGCQLGVEALRLARRWQPDALVVDLGLPDISGLDVARTVRADPALQHVRLIALTGQSGRATRERCAAAGFDQYMAKPVDVEDLESALPAPVAQ